jgi:predicted ATPase
LHVEPFVIRYGQAAVLRLSCDFVPKGAKMLTRLKVTGFKNLVDVDVQFGPFTCIAGPNGTGKSNLFDAITFLSRLASDTLINAAIAVRDERGRTGDVRNLFHRVGTDYTQKMSFEAEMLIPREGVDDLGQKAVASITFVKYRLELAYRVDPTLPTLGSLELVHEGLDRIKLNEAARHLRFAKEAGTWRRSVLNGRRTTPLISTEDASGNMAVKLHQDGIQGRARSFLAANLPRTVLSTVNATESPTALLARREMQSWRLLQLEPSALREPDRFTTPPGLGADGSHLPATLYNLARPYLQPSKTSTDCDDVGPYRQVAFSLGELIEDVSSLRVDADVKRELLTLEVTDRYGTVHPARSLSDGTLRFLALAVLKIDPEFKGLICLEEPENGIHPERIPAILRLLQDIATHIRYPIGTDNPLRQVIVNTHSPASGGTTRG